MQGQKTKFIYKESPGERTFASSHDTNLLTAFQMQMTLLSC